MLWALFLLLRAGFRFPGGGFFGLRSLHLDFFDGRSQHREAFFSGRGLFAQAGEFPKLGDIATIVTGIVDGCFQDESAASQALEAEWCRIAVRENAREGFGADFAFADIFVAIDAAAERDLRVVDVENRDASRPMVCQSSRSWK